MQVRFERKQCSVIPLEFPIACDVLAILSHKSRENFEANPRDIVVVVVVVEEVHRC